MTIIAARDLQVGDTILDGKKSIEVHSIEYGKSCHGIHVNVVRRETRAVKRGGKVVGLNPDRGQILSVAGCWSAVGNIVIRRGN